MTEPTPLDINEDLIRASQKGDRSAFARLLELVYDVILRFTMKWVSHVSDAEDITQTLCIKLAKVIRQFRFESSFKTWLYRIVVNCVRDWQRSQKRHLSEDISFVEHGSSQTAIEGQAELERVLLQIEAMGKGFKETVLLVHGEGFSHAEAAETLDVKESTISWRLHEVRKQLFESSSAQGAESL